MFEVSRSYLNLVFQQNQSDTTLMGEGDCSLITCQMKVENMPQSAALGGMASYSCLGVSVGSH